MEKSSRPLAVAALALLLLAGPTLAQKPAPSVVSKTMADLLIGFQQQTQLKTVLPVQRYGKENLAEYVGDAAQSYFAFGFEQLTSGEFTFPDQPTKSFMIDIYQMGSQRNTRLIFLKEGNKPTPGLSVGSQACQNSDGLAFYRGAYYVKFKAFSPDKAFLEQLYLLAIKLDSILYPHRQRGGA